MPKNLYKNKISTATITDQVDNILRRMILTGELTGNQQIKERELSEMLNVSTTPIKESLRRLEAEGLIYRKPRVGTFVSNFSKEVMLQTVFMRSALDGVAAFFACKNASDEELEELGQVVLDMEKSAKDDADSSVVRKQNELFHDKIRQCANNSYLSLLLSNMAQIDQLFRDLALTKQPVEVKRSFSEHQAIYMAISDRNAEEAERLMNSHVRRIAINIINKGHKTPCEETKEE